MNALPGSAPGEERARWTGRLLMAAAALLPPLFLAAAARRSYAALALPVGAGLAALATLAFWVGYTMAFARYDEDEDAPPLPPFPPSDAGGEAPPAGA